MGQTTIEWTSSVGANGVRHPGYSINYWWGCCKISAACNSCYAETRDAHFHPTLHKDERPKGEGAIASHWGPDAPRLIRVEAAKKEAFKLERLAVKESRRIRVFTNSMSDFFEDRRDLDAARLEALDTMRLTPHLDWLILTKRPEKILELLKLAEADAPGSGYSDWLRAWLHGTPPPNIWVGVTVETQEWADIRIPELVKVPLVIRFLSMEPLLGSVCLSQNLPEERMLRWCHWMIGMIDWVIVGGESGPKARPTHIEWIRSICDQCLQADVPFFFKQHGEYAPGLCADNCFVHLCEGVERPNRVRDKNTHDWGKGHVSQRIGRKAAGRLLDGREWNGSPQVGLLQEGTG